MRLTRSSTTSVATSAASKVAASVVQTLAPQNRGQEPDMSLLHGAGIIDSMSKQVVEFAPEQSARRRAVIVGAGLMGGSVGAALRQQGWFVSAIDSLPTRAERGVELGLFDSVGPDDQAALTVICTPVLAVPDAVKSALSNGGVVTDIGSVKGPIVDLVDHPRFVGGHPMAGSELEGIEGADPAMFVGRTWVLTPTQTTEPAAFALVHAVATAAGAMVVAVDPRRHDAIVATVSHVPHLMAATLMSFAADSAVEHATLLRMAAGGFRDMTRIAGGHQDIWLDICEQNRAAIVQTLDALLGRLGNVREMVESGDRSGLRAHLEHARTARLDLPVGAPPPEELVSVRTPIPDRPGYIAEVTTLVGELDVNVWTIDVVHSPTGGRGVLEFVVNRSVGDLVRGALIARGYRPSISDLGSTS